MTTVLPKASAGALFHAGIAIGKFHGVISPKTPSGSRYVSTATPGRVESTVTPCRRKRFSREELEDARSAHDLAFAFGKGLAFLA